MSDGFASQAAVGVDSDPHRGQPLLTSGAPIEGAAGALILLHGRGASAASILPLGDELGRSDLAYLAPQAAGSTWYPFGFMAPTEKNEPWLSSALARLDRIVERLEQQGIPTHRIALAAFSQGACLAATYAATRPRRYAGVLVFTGGLSGPPGTTWPAEGSLDGTPVFLGAGDPDPHVPRGRIAQTALYLEKLGARVTERIYPGLGHTINQDELTHARDLLSGLPAREMPERPRT